MFATLADFVFATFFREVFLIVQNTTCREHTVEQYRLVIDTASSTIIMKAHHLILFAEIELDMHQPGWCYLQSETFFFQVEEIE